MIRIAIVEDDENYKKQFTEYLRKYEKESGRRFQVSLFSDGDEICDNYSAEYDIILLDIAMRYMDGMSAAERIRESDNNVIIIFMTSMPQYAMRGYTVDALDYVLKPVNYFAFTQRIERALNKMRRKDRNFVVVNFHGGLKKLIADEITYVEVLDHDLVYHSGGETYTVRGTLTEAEEALGKKFFRISKSYLVNLEYVENVRQNDVNVGGDTIAVARARKKALLDALNDYMNGTVR